MTASNIYDRSLSSECSEKLSPSQLALAEVRDWGRRPKKPSSIHKEESGVPLIDKAVNQGDVVRSNVSTDGSRFAAQQESRSTSAQQATVNQANVVQRHPEQQRPEAEESNQATTDANQLAATSRTDKKTDASNDGNDSKPRPSRALIVAAIVLFPLTFYLLLGSGILYLVFRLELAARRLTSYFAFNDLMDEPDYSFGYGEHILFQRLRYFMYRRYAVRWHVRSLMLTFLFPLFAPLLALAVCALFCWACFRAGRKGIVDTLRAGADEFWAVVTAWFSKH